MARVRRDWIAVAVLVGIAGLASPGALADPEWRCKPIDPRQEKVPEPPCFRARLTSQNRVQLQWQVRGSGSRVYIYDVQGPEYRDPGFFPAHCGEQVPPQCGATLGVGGGGAHRWSLKVVSRSGQALYVPAELFVPSPRKPRILAGDTEVDFLAPRARTIRWQVDSGNGWDELDIDRAWMEVSLPGKLGFEQRHYPRSGPDATLAIPAAAFDRVGETTYLVRDCALPEPGSDKFCSPAASVTFNVTVDRFLGDSVILATPGEDVLLSFTTRSGNLRMLVSDTLIPARGGQPVVTTRAATYTIPAHRLVPGVHKVELVSCVTPELACANRKDATPAQFDGRVETVGQQFSLRGDPIAAVYPPGGGKPQTITAPADGVVHFSRFGPENSVRRGDPIAFVITDASDVVYVLVDDPVAWDSERDYLLDFEVGLAVSTGSSGQALDTVFDATGGIWQTSEFANSIDNVDRTGRAYPVEVPLGRQTGSDRLRYDISRPFALWTSASAPVATSVSALSERVTRAGPVIWFTQGGGLKPGRGGDARNYSRVIAVDTTVADSPRTLFDDRLCIYNLPTEDAAGFGNNQLLGLAVSRGRIWLAESRGLLDKGGSVISVFLPGADLCFRVPDFEEPGALPPRSLEYCTAGHSPEQDGCLQRIPLETPSGSVKVAHLEADPADGSVWFSDARGRFLGNVDPQREDVVRLFRIPDEHRDAFDGMPLFGGFPWALRVDTEAVYVGEYATRHILRFDKSTATFDEIQIPCRNTQVSLHSLDLDSVTRRLWFTLANEHRSPLDAAASTIGYIDLDSWQAHATHPGPGRKVNGVIYAGLDRIQPSPDLPDSHQSFRGIAVDPASGRIAVATMWREQVTVLTPHASFWP